MKNKGLLIICAGGHGKVVANTALQMNCWKNIAFLDDDIEKESVLSFPIIGALKNCSDYINKYEVIVAIGSNRIRKEIQRKLVKLGANFATIIHPKSIIGEEVEIGKGTVIFAGAIIESGTKIGKGCIINTSATINHDCYIGDYVHISPASHLGGTVEIGDETWIGIGGIIRNNIKISAGTIIGAGGLVIKDIDNAGIFVGVPVHEMR